MRLSEFIKTDAERIIREWVELAKTLLGEADLPRWFLRVHIAAILQSIAEDIERVQVPFEQQAQEKGETPGPIEYVAAVHVDLRIESGFDLVQIMAESRALRACVLRLWRETDPEGFLQGAEEITRFGAAVDRAVAETVPAYEQRDARYRDRFLAMLGHDLRNPLNSILLSATSLAAAEGPLNEKQLTTVSRIASSAQRLNHMVNDILDFARGRLESPMPITRARANLETIAREVADEVRSANPEFLVHVDTQGDLDGDWDSERVRQLLSNLLTNATHHGGGSKVGLNLKGEKNLVLLDVHNEGPPIGEELLGTLFDPLVQGKSSTQNRNGLGLGLFIVKEIVSAHKGTVSVASSEDAGTTFSVSLPRH